MFGLKNRITALGGACGVRDNPEATSGSVFWFEIPYLIDDSALSMSQLKSNSEDCSDYDDESTPFMKMNMRTITGVTDFGSSSPVVTPRLECENSFSGSNSSKTVGRFYPSALKKSRREPTSIPSSVDNLPLLAEVQAFLHHSPLKTMVVDDSPTIRKLMQKALVRIGIDSVKCFDNGLKGLNAMLAQEYDIVFSDVQMPVMTGPEVIFPSFPPFLNFLLMKCMICCVDGQKI